MPMEEKLVYLHELDSVRNSPEELDHAQDVLLHELLIKGHVVVLSFNQFGDSRLILGKISESDEMFDLILSFVKTGRIRLARYGNVRTVSQYLQNSIYSAQTKSNGGFIFSGRDYPNPVGGANPLAARFELLESMQVALRNGEPSYLFRHSDKEERRRGFGFRERGDDPAVALRPGLKGTYLEEARYLYPDGKMAELERIVRFAIAASEDEASYVQPRLKPCRFRKCMELMTDKLCGPLADGAERGIERHLEVARLLKDNRASWPEGDNRSAWHNAITGLGFLPADLWNQMAQMVDLCYNLTIELGIDGVSHHFSPENGMANGGFTGEVIERLKSYRDDYRIYGHEYEYAAGQMPGSPSRATPPVKARKWAWNAADHFSNILARWGGKAAGGGGNDGSLVYEAEPIAHWLAWRLHLFRCCVQDCAVSLAFLAIAGFYECNAADVVRGWFGGLSLEGAVSSALYVLSVFSACIFGSWVVEKIRRLPSLFDSFERLWRTVRRGVVRSAFGFSCHCRKAAGYKNKRTSGFLKRGCKTTGSDLHDSDIYDLLK